MKLSQSKEWLQQKYEVEKLSTAKIGSIIGCSNSTVQNRLKRFGIPLRKCSHFA